MTENTIKTYEAFIRNHHSDKIFDCVERAYSMWNRQHRGVDDVKFLTFMKEKGITDDDLWIPLAAGMLKVWIKNEDLYYDRSVYYNQISGLIGSKNPFGEVSYEIKVTLNPCLPNSIEEYIKEQKEKTLSYNLSGEITK